MKKIKLYLLGKKYEIEIEDGFYNYIEKDIKELDESKNQIKSLLDLMLKFAYKSYKNEQKIDKILKKIDFL